MKNQWNCPTCTVRQHPYGKGCADLRICVNAVNHPNQNTAFYLNQPDQQQTSGIGISEIANKDENQ